VLLFNLKGAHIDIDWNNIIKKEARGKNDADLDEVQEVGIHIFYFRKD
jgi:hypothetical protein